MTTEPIQNPLFDDPLGITLKHARLRKDLSIEAAARQLRLPIAVIEAMEREAWQTLGAPVYAKSYLGSYLKLLGLPETLVDNLRNKSSEPGLVTMVPGGKIQRTLDRSWRRIIYMVMTGVLVGSVAMLAVHLQSSAPPAQSISLGAPLDIGAGAEPVGADVDIPNQPAILAAAEASTIEPAQEAPAPPLVASMAPLPLASEQSGLVLDFRGDSWVDILDGAGQSIERGVVPGGTQRRYPAGSVSRLTLGNAAMVDVREHGQPVDLAPYVSENVARFGVSSEGRISAPGR